MQSNKCYIHSFRGKSIEKEANRSKCRVYWKWNVFRKVHILYKLYQFTWKACSILSLLAKVPWSFNVSDQWQTHVLFLFLFPFLPSFSLWDQKQLIFQFLAGLPRAQSARGTEPHTHGIWSTSFRLVVTWLTERTYVRTYASTDCTGGVGETIKREGCLRRVLASPHL